MSAITEAFRLSAELLEQRDAARVLLGVEYKSTMAEYGKVITAVAAKADASLLDAALQICKGVDNRMFVVCVMAATVELLGPSA